MQIIKIALHIMNCRYSKYPSEIICVDFSIKTLLLGERLNCENIFWSLYFLESLNPERIAYFIQRSADSSAVLKYSSIGIYTHFLILHAAVGSAFKILKAYRRYLYPLWVSFIIHFFKYSNIALSYSADFGSIVIKDFIFLFSFIFIFGFWCATDKIIQKNRKFV